MLDRSDVEYDDDGEYYGDDDSTDCADQIRVSAFDLKQQRVTTCV